MRAFKAPRTVSTPSRGVQQWPDPACGASTRIAWASEGGRGLARWIILFPVVPRADGQGGPPFAPPPALMHGLERDPANAWGKYPLLRRDARDSSVRTMFGPADDRDAGAPRSVSVPNDFGAPWGTRHLVVLLVHEGLADIGEPGDAVAAPTGDPVVRAIERFFGDGYEDRLLLRGLVRLPVPPRADAPVVFALASCQYPCDITDGAPNNDAMDAPATASLASLSRTLRTSPDTAPSLLVLVGDQVYLDATAGLFDARSQDDQLRLPYQNLMANRGAQAVFGLIPVAMMLDDHEIADNWEPGAAAPSADGRPTTKWRTVSGFAAERKRAYQRFQRMAGPPVQRKALWYTFHHAGVPFFVADTRTERGVPPFNAPRRVDNWRRARIMRQPQWDALVTFLVDHQDTVAFVASPAMLLPRTLGLQDEESLALSCDGWDGYPSSMHELLALLCEHDMQRVVFLSGDAHTSMIVRGTVTRPGHHATFWSIHSSGLYSPYPFANDIEENFAVDETFTFSATAPACGGREDYTCTVEKILGVPGDGYATLTLEGGGRAGHVLRVCFSRATGDVECHPICLAAAAPPARGV